MSKISINNELLLLYNKKGIFPYPNELKESFFKKIDRTSLNVEECDKEKFSYQKLKDLFDISPNWAKVEFTSKGLRFWEAGALEINKNEYHLKLNPRFKKKRAYLGLYDQSEVLMHELVHLGRKDFNEPKYEEVFAYQTSKGLRKLLGPLFQSPNESIVLFALSILSLVGGLVLTSIPLRLLVKYAPAFYLFFLSFRLFLRSFRFKRCLKKLATLVTSPSQALPLMYRLSDDEIDCFSKSSILKIKKYIQNQKELRWSILKEAYFADRRFYKDKTSSKS